MTSPTDTNNRLHPYTQLFSVSNPVSDSAGVPASGRSTISSAANEVPTEGPTLSNTMGLALEYVHGDPYDTFMVNGEKFALINERSWHTIVELSGENVVLDLPDHHLLILNPISAASLTLKGKSITIISGATVSGNVNLTVPRDSGNVIFYGGSKDPINIRGNCSVTAKQLIQKGVRIETIRIEDNGTVTEEVIDYHSMVKDLFQEGIAHNSSSVIALALLKAGHEILFSEGNEVRRANILKLWNIP